MYLYKLICIKIPTFLPSLNIPIFSTFEPKSVDKLFLSAKGVALPQREGNLANALLLENAKKMWDKVINIASKLQSQSINSITN